MSDCYVYVIATKRDGQHVAPVKIGVSNSPNGRLDALQTASPYELELIFYFVAPSRQIAFALEQAFLECMGEFRLHGEWFDLNPGYAVCAMALCIQAHLIFAIPELSHEEHAAAMKLSRADEAWEKFRGCGSNLH